MTALYRTGLVLLFFLLPTISGVAQFGTRATCVESGLPANGALATTRAIVWPASVIADSSGGCYIARPTQNRVYRVASDGRMSVAAGGWLSGYSGDGGQATSAQLASPYGVTVDAGGNLFIADTWNHRIRRVTPSGTMSTVAGNGAIGYSGDGGPATSAQLNHPHCIAVDGGGNLYIADTFNYRIRRVTPLAQLPRSFDHSSLFMRGSDFC